MHLSRLQDEVTPWANHNFGVPGHDPTRTRVGSTLGLCEEVGEVARAVLKQHQGIRGTFEEWQDEIIKELGDVVIKCAEVAAICGIDLNAAVARRWFDVQERDFKKDAQGHGLPQEEN